MPRLYLLLASLFVVGDLCAQSGEPRIRVQFRALSFEGALLGVGYLDGKEVRPLDLSSDCFTAEQSYAGPNPLRLVVREDAAGLPAAAPAVAHPAPSRMLALSQELETVQRRLATLSADARERGGRGKAGADKEIGLLKARSEALNQEMAALAQASTQPLPGNSAPPGAHAKPGARDGPAPAQAAVRPARPPHRPLASFAFPGDGRFLLLVHQTAGGTTVNAIDDREGAFPYGSMQFVNLTAGPVEVRFGAKTLALAAKAKGTLRPDAGNTRYAEGEIHARGDDGQLHLGYAMRVFQQDDVRTLYFLLPTEDGGHGVRLKGVEERRAVEPTPPPPGLPGEKPAAPLR
ncbi:MAG: hypothetical protein RLZZ550_1859 [Verrucomicrobiota bacterium]